MNIEKYRDAVYEALNNMWSELDNNELEVDELDDTEIMCMLKFLLTQGVVSKKYGICIPSSVITPHEIDRIRRWIDR